MTLGKWSVSKYERGFAIHWDGPRSVYSFPYIPKWYYKPLYPWAFWKAVGAIREQRRIHALV